MLIGIVGMKSSGKDTFADYIRQTHSFIKYAFATPLKRACQELFLLSEEQLYDPLQKEIKDSRWGLSPREMFQFIGTDVMRDRIHPDVWLQHFTYWYQCHREEHVVICDVRFQNEIDLIKSQGGIIIKVIRPSLSLNTLDGHVSETGIHDLIRIDYVLQNNSTPAHYYHQIDQLMAMLFSSPTPSFTFEDIQERIYG